MILPDFSKSRILVVGDVMLDRYLSGGTDRISPEAPVPVVQVQRITDKPGGAANVALNLAALGNNVTLLGIVGNDSSADDLRTCLKNTGIDLHLLTTESSKTITKMRVVSRNQQLYDLTLKSFSRLMLAYPRKDLYRSSSIA